MTIETLIKREKELLQKINNLEHTEEELQELLNIAVQFSEYYKNGK